MYVTFGRLEKKMFLNHFSNPVNFSHQGKKKKKKSPQMSKKVIIYDTAATLFVNGFY